MMSLFTFIKTRCFSTNFSSNLFIAKSFRVIYKPVFTTRQVSTSTQHYSKNHNYFNKDQTNILNSIFDKEKYPSSTEKHDLSIRFNRTEKSISKWFTSARSKQRKNGIKIIDNRRFNLPEINILKSSFEKECYPDELEKRDLAQQLDVDIMKVDRWFRRERCNMMNSNTILSSNKSRRKVFNDDDLEILNSMFSQNLYPNTETINHLADILGKESVQVREWFRRARKKYRDSEINGN